MTPRLLALALAVVRTGAPVLSNVCQAACPARSASPHGEHHSCHASASSNQARVDGVAHDCGHTDGSDQIGADQAIKLLPPVTVAVTEVTFALQAPSSTELF